MKRFEAVIFDMDGVIFDSELLVIKCWQVVADKYGIKNIEDTCHKCLGLNKDATKELMLGVYGADFPYDEYKAELFHYCSIYKEVKVTIQTYVFFYINKELIQYECIGYYRKVLQERLRFI